MATRGSEYNIPKDFLNNKQQTLNQIDRSKKGSIDAPITALIDKINESPRCYTTSSCSGRIIVFSEREGATKQNCKWIFTSHKECTLGEVTQALREQVTCEDKVITLKFEPLILHICCADMESSKVLMKVAVACGYRNSGLSIGKKIMLAVRSTQGLEVPIGRGGAILVGDGYLEFLIEQANVKMMLNCERIKVLEAAIASELLKLSEVLGSGEGKVREETILKKNGCLDKKKEKQINCVEEFKNETNILESLFS